MPGLRFYGLFDQAGVFAPLAAEEAATLRALPGVDCRYLAAGVTGHNVGGFAGNVGFLHPLGVADAPLATAAGYFGVAPGTIQPGIDKPDPWTTPGG